MSSIANPLALESFPEEELIERRAADTNATGNHPLWTGYQNVPDYPRAAKPTRTANQVRTTASYGRFYVWLVKQRQARVVVEFGTAFGVSGMYWMSGLKTTGGHLMTYEPNGHWSVFARQNLQAIGPDFTLTEGTFEEHAAATLEPGSVDIGFIDAIHTSDFVFAQLEILRKYMKPGGIVVLDDVRFSPDMRSCWRKVARADYVQASVSVQTRIGVIELI